MVGSSVGALAVGRVAADVCVTGLFEVGLLLGLTVPVTVNEPETAAAPAIVNETVCRPAVTNLLPGPIV